jgi:hypothetical protein
MSKDRVIEIFELMELLELGGQKTNNINNTGSAYRNGNDTNSTIGIAEVEVKQNNKTLVSGSKIWNLIEDKVSSVNFFRCSRYLKRIMTNLSTKHNFYYLSRYSERGKLIRSKKEKK